MGVIDTCKERGIRLIELQEFNELPNLHISNAEDFLDIQSGYIFYHEDVANSLSFVEYLIGEIVKESVSDYRQQSEIKKSIIDGFLADGGFLSKHSRETKNTYFISKDNTSYFIENEFPYTEDQIGRIKKKIERALKEILSDKKEQERQKNESIMNTILERKEDYSKQTTETKRTQIINEIRIVLSQKLKINGYMDGRASKDFVRMVLESDEMANELMSLYKNEEE